MNKKLLISIIFLLVVSNIVSAAIEQDNVIINSKEWKDVYSSMVYANLNGKKASFILSPSYATIILNYVPKGSSVLAISSKNNAYIKGFKTIMNSNGYEGTELILDNANLELANRLDSSITKFIVIDDKYGYNAISVASYAAVSKSYVLFANSINIDNIVTYLNSRKVDNLIIFGQVDRAVKDSLAPFNPEIINNGDRFDNNLAITDKYLVYKDSKQAIMTNGEFIEESIMNGDNPVIFIGKNNVPDSVRSYISKSNFQVAVLIGNELVGSATFIKRQLGISVFVKFAQGARNPAGSIATVEDLDKFPMPNYKVVISVPEIRYNTATKQIEVTYQNDENLAAYLLPTLTVKVGNDEYLVNTSEETFFLDGKEVKTIGYNFEFPNGIPEKANVSLYVLFGEAPKSLEFAYQGDRELSFVNVIDDSEIQITSVLYDKSKKRFEIEVENLKNIDTYASGEMINLLINGEYKNYGSDLITHLSPLKKATIYVNTPEFEEADFLNNNFVKATVFYGQRERSLIKVVAGEYEFILTKGQYIVYGLVILLIIILVLVFVLGKKCRKCKTQNPPFRKRCRKCGERLD